MKTIQLPIKLGTGEKVIGYVVFFTDEIDTKLPLHNYNLAPSFIPKRIEVKKGKRGFYSDIVESEIIDFRLLLDSLLTNSRGEHLIPIKSKEKDEK